VTELSYLKSNFRAGMFQDDITIIFITGPPTHSVGSERRYIYSSVSARARRRARHTPFVWNRAACGRRIGICRYTAIPEDGRTCLQIKNISLPSNSTYADSTESAARAQVVQRSTEREKNLLNLLAKLDAALNSFSLSKHRLSVCLSGFPAYHWVIPARIKTP